MKAFKVLLSGLVLVFPFVLFAEETLPDSAFWEALIAFLGGVGNMSVLSIALAVTQLGVVFFKTMMGQAISGKVTILVVSGLTLVSTILGSLVSGMSFMDAIFSSAVLIAMQVFVSELLKQPWQKQPTDVVRV